MDKVVDLAEAKAAKQAAKSTVTLRRRPALTDEAAIDRLIATLTVAHQAILALDRRVGALEQRLGALERGFDQLIAQASRPL
jgi:hypothetical protein